MKRLPSYPPIEGQLDVFEVLELVDKEGLVPSELHPQGVQAGKGCARNCLRPMASIAPLNQREA